MCNGIVYCIRFSPDDSRFATAAGYSTQIWNARTGVLELTIKESVKSLAWTKDGTEVIAGGRSRTTIYSATTGDQLHSWEAHNNCYLSAFSLSPTSTLLATSSQDNHLAAIWDIQTGQQVATYQHPRNLQCIAYSSTGKSIATACHDRNAYLWEAPDESQKLEDILDLPAVQSPGEDEVVTEAGRGEFIASCLDLPATARPSHFSSRVNAPQQPAHPSRGIKGIIKGLLTKSPPARDDIELDQIGEGRAGRSAARTWFGGRTLVAASRDLIVRPPPFSISRESSAPDVRAIIAGCIRSAFQSTALETSLCTHSRALPAGAAWNISHAVPGRRECRAQLYCSGDHRARTGCPS
ncbi:hypothetical protein HYDPIDRAFT_119541 [Hydnomerulius pinastri MD-312]|uniref:Anaphase-promoting complex subunit 4 WD40 domain-containing protein n=1 Tax=Hydnomerulius pinastri MD-312 TaxID=994086 RepID=A0A0C9UZF6_9AGAM|nr:hypothetical protein HYDPIDRAFT_119541 [Hydnomerulius pinastri MD-312]